MKQKVLIYKGFERFWHWTQAFLVIFLALTGFEIHGVYSFLGYKEAVRWHNNAAYMFLGLTAFAIFWHLTTGEYRHYLPTVKNLKAYIQFYLVGIFRNAPHPTKKTLLSKLNPLQRLTYLGLKIVVFPLSIGSGLLYMFYRYPTRHGTEKINVASLETIAVIHTLSAFLLVTFLIVHIYLTTTGRTPLSNLRAMITGYEEIEEDEKQSSQKHAYQEKEALDA